MQNNRFTPPCPWTSSPVPSMTSKDLVALTGRLSFWMALVEMKLWVAPRSTITTTSSTCIIPFNFTVRGVVIPSTSLGNSPVVQWWTTLLGLPRRYLLVQSPLSPPYCRKHRWSRPTLFAGIETQAPLVITFEAQSSLSPVLHFLLCLLMFVGIFLVFWV